VKRRTQPITTEGTLPRRAIAAGEKATRPRRSAVGRSVSREPHPVEAMTPGLSEKFTGPITPRSPARTLATPVTRTPRVSRRGCSDALSSSFKDWMEPMSFTARARKQKIKEIRTPASSSKPPGMSWRAQLTRGALRTTCADVKVPGKSMK